MEQGEGKREEKGSGEGKKGGDVGQKEKRVKKGKREKGKREEG